MAQALALLHLGRAEEAASGLSSLTGQLSDAGDRRILAFVLGIARRAAGLDPTSALREALDLEAPNGPSGP